MDKRIQQGMTCPFDGATLVMSDRQGIEIHYCPICRGVCLDRGELDKIIARNEAIAPPAQPVLSPEPWLRRHRCDDEGRHQRGRRKSFLEQLFD